MPLEAKPSKTLYFFTNSVLTISPGLNEVEGIRVSQETKAKVADRTYVLKTVGAGLRYKKVAFIKAKVYVGELMMKNPEKFQKRSDGALVSLSCVKTVAMRMTFLRNVDGLVNSVFSMWLGKMEDSGLLNLKKEILGIKD